MRLLELLLTTGAFIRARWGYRFSNRAELEKWQNTRIEAFLRKTASKAGYYKQYANASLQEIPIATKSLTLTDFERFNTLGIALGPAMSAALDAEQSRDFTPTLPARPGARNEITVGLSSGTQGKRGLFLASATERAAWAGILLARVLSTELLRVILFRPRPLRVAFFLRANSNLYTTLKSRRIDFRFFDLHKGIDAHLDALQCFDPEVLVAPASVLGWLARRTLAEKRTMNIRKVISVAEVLEPDDAALVGSAFKVDADQLYQCTEGFLAYTCNEGSLHLNEEFVHIEPEWLDESRTRFMPIVTDFTRKTQMVIRYRLTDVLSYKQTSNGGEFKCQCGRVTRVLRSIEGRADDIVWLRAKNEDRLIPIFPDVVRQVVAIHAGELQDYRLVQREETIGLALRPNCDKIFSSLTKAIGDLAASQDAIAPVWQKDEISVDPPTMKRRRILCESRPVLQHKAMQ